MGQIHGRLPTRAGARNVSSCTPRLSPGSRAQAIEAGDVVAGDLATDALGDAREVLVEGLQRVRPDAVRMRIVGAPDDVVLTDERDDRLQILVLLVGHVALAAEVVAGTQRETQLTGAVLVLGVEPVAPVGQPRHPRLTAHELEGGVL